MSFKKELEKDFKKAVEESEIFKPILNKDGTKTKYEISTYGRIYNTETKEYIKPKILKRWHNNYSGKDKEAPKEKWRNVVYLTFNDWVYQGAVARLVLMTFKPLKDYTNMDCDHIDNNPQNDHLSNLQWLTSEENKKKSAKERGRSYTVYEDELIHSICQDICNGLTRQELIKKYKIPYQLVDDIKSGRSHRNTSKLYEKHGLVLRKYNKEELLDKQKFIEKICMLIDRGFNNSEIRSIMNLPSNESCLPNDIRKFRIYKYISKNYNFYKEANDKKKEIKYDKKIN